MILVVLSFMMVSLGLIQETPSFILEMIFTLGISFLFNEVHMKEKKELDIFFYILFPTLIAFYLLKVFADSSFIHYIWSMTLIFFISLFEDKDRESFRFTLLFFFFFYFIHALVIFWLEKGV